MSKTALRSAYPFAIGNLGGIIGPQIYRSDDAPLYTRGHFINGACIALMIVTTMVLMLSIEREGLYTGAKANLSVRDVADAEARTAVLEHNEEGKKEVVV
ncbi:hypothetical protein HDU93_003618 [Gonapodya sp. JEL0774]|nr:hypothetical protein HDU93_003618 [Gonapodya sp. JEL0774]